MPRVARGQVFGGPGKAWRPHAVETRALHTWLSAALAPAQRYF